MVEFAPRKDRTASRMRADAQRYPEVRIKPTRMTDFPNTLTSASLLRELERRVATGSDPVKVLADLTAAVQRWIDKDKPRATGVVLVEVNGSRLAYEASEPVAVGDEVLVHTSIMGNMHGRVAVLNASYDGPVKRLTKVAA